MAVKTGRNASTEAAIEGLRAQVARLREEARNTHQEEELTVSEARSVSDDGLALACEILKMCCRISVAATAVNAASSRGAHRPASAMLFAQLSMNLVAKQQQLLLETERVKALEKTRADPTVSLMQSVQQQLTSPAADSIIAPHKEPLCFIAEKCNKLVRLFASSFL